MQDLLKFTTRLQDVAVASPATNIIPQFKESKTLFQEITPEENEQMLMAECHTVLFIQTFS